jgi:glycosyltransferase involved in cell wall biosynthesis
MVDLSIVVPLFNEEDNVLLLHKAIVDALGTLSLTYELVLVDDGSGDQTLNRAASLTEHDSHVRVVALRHNFGQTAATVAGFQVARGNVIVTMDGDLQNDPNDIPRLLALIDDGYDIVVGWRKKRQDGGARVFVSKVANRIMARIMGTSVKDSGCSLKCYRAELIKNLPLYGEMHRFIPVLSRMAGARLAQIEVQHHPRRFGVSKYGFARIYKVMLDIISIRFLLEYSRRPFLWVGWMTGIWLMAGIISLFAGMLVGQSSFIVLKTGVATIFFSTGVFFFAWGLVGLLFTRSEGASGRFAALAAALSSRTRKHD